MTPLTFKIGLDSFGEVADDDGRTLGDAETPPRRARARTIESLGREVAPLVRELFTKESFHV
ncbi:hypothetical protein [Streptomyces sp. NBC_01176]|uniref:hypothetical protein n=1 Tax=Streptomyces sp. NBC_01176 TaxID=2903760 RepID=UPI0038696B4C|nr:hypothetical protein OG199_42160 [Streptomyces sp. NBC_01176]